MAKDKYHIESLTTELIEKYHQGNLSEEEQYAVEKLMLNSAFDADAMDGFEQNTSLAADLTLLNKQLDDRIEKEKKSTITFWLKIAASVLLIAVCAYFVFDNSFKQTTNEETLALQKDEVAETPSAKEIELKNQEPVTVDENEAKPETPEDLIALNKTLIVKDEEMTPITTQPKEVQKPVEEEFIAMADDTEEEDKNESLTQTIIEPIPEAEKSDVAERQAKRSSIAKSMAAEGVASKKTSSSSIPSSISGKVTSADDGSPLVGVNVVIKGSNVGTVTDLDGNYKIDSLPLDGDTQLEFSFIGLASEEVSVNNRNHLDITMNSDVRQLSEVVITRSTAGNTADTENVGFQNAEPLIGMPQYKSYLKDKVQYPEADESLSGRVVVKFDIDLDGSLSNFEIKKSLGELYDQEAIRLIKEGPKWKPAMSNGQAIESSERVTVRFNR